MKTTTPRLVCLPFLLVSALSVFAFSQAHAQMMLVEDFNDIDAGNFSGNDDWTQRSFTNQAGSFAVVDTAPASDSNHALSNHDVNDRALITSLGASINEDTSDTVGTLYFRFYLDTLASTGTHVGLGTSAFNDFTHYRPELVFNGSGSTILTVFDGTTTRLVNNITMEEKVWYDFWMVADNDERNWTGHIRGGNISDITQISTSAGSTFNFRSGSAGALDTLAVARGTGGVDDNVFLDDFYFGLGNNVGVIPEPGSTALLLGGLGLLLARRSRR